MSSRLERFYSLLIDIKCFANSFTSNRTQTTKQLTQCALLDNTCLTTSSDSTHSILRTLLFRKTQIRITCHSSNKPIGIHFEFVLFLSKRTLRFFASLTANSQTHNSAIGFNIYRITVFVKSVTLGDSISLLGERRWCDSHN